jgi:hypothetical protein
VRRTVALRGRDFFICFLRPPAALRIVICELAGGGRDVWDWVGSLKGELFSTGRPRALMI